MPIQMRKFVLPNGARGVRSREESRRAPEWCYLPHIVDANARQRLGKCARIRPFHNEREGLDIMNTPNPYAAPRAAVADISTAAESEPADRIVRLAAAILDGIIVMAIIYIPLLLGGGASIYMAVLTGRQPEVGAGFAIWSLIAFIGFIAWIWVTIVLVARNGQTIAKKLLSIKVVRSDGSKASLGRIFWLRNFVNGLLGIIPLYQLVDILFIFGDQRQCLHDKIADTIVVKA
jgi:uncharacterized RDD family membrane protein YckC